MPNNMMKFALALLLATLATMAAAEAQAEVKAEAVKIRNCACEAVEFGNNTVTMFDAMTYLKASTCATDCTSAECKKIWLIVQIHHNYCPEEGIPKEIQDSFHDYDMTCMHS